MTRQYIRYVKEEVEALIKECSSYAEALRKLGKSSRGGTLTNFVLMCRRWSIDTSHMTGQAHNKGKPARHRLTPHERLVMGCPTDHRVTAYKLRNALFEIGVEHKCSDCGIKEWNGQQLVLEIDHIDGQYWNNTPDNLRFLCPNCHSLTPTFRSKNFKNNA